MKRVVPDYYADFACVAGACRHTCCVGWEIDIDPDSLRRYQAMPGEMGERLRSYIDIEETPHFRLTADERCPLLNTNGLCDLIIRRRAGCAMSDLRRPPALPKHFVRPR